MAQTRVFHLRGTFQTTRQPYSYSPKSGFAVACTPPTSLVTGMDRPLTVGVCGSGNADNDLTELAETVGRLIAQSGAWLLCGGLDGVMAGASRGARAAGGRTIGLLPGRDRAAANPWIDIPIATGLNEGRNLLIVMNADGVIALPGGSGTLSEIALAMKIGTPVLDCGGWNIDGMRPRQENLEQTIREFVMSLKGSTV